MSLQMFDLTGQRALITGSSQGIGFALARGLAGVGAEIVLNGRDEGKLASAAKALAEEGATVHQLAFDATDHEGVRSAVDGFEAADGPIDILINNAGMQHRTELENFPADAFERLLQTNVASVFHVGQAVARHMIARGDRQNYQHRLGADRARTARNRTLHRNQRRSCQPHERHGDGLGAARSKLQRYRAGVF